MRATPPPPSLSSFLALLGGHWLTSNANTSAHIHAHASRQHQDGASTQAESAQAVGWTEGVSTCDAIKTFFIQLFPLPLLQQQVSSCPFTLIFFLLPFFKNRLYEVLPLSSWSERLLILPSSSVLNLRMDNSPMAPRPSTATHAVLSCMEAVAEVQPWELFIGARMSVRRGSHAEVWERAVFGLFFAGSSLGWSAFTP